MSINTNTTTTTKRQRQLRTRSSSSSSSSENETTTSAGLESVRIMQQERNSIVGREFKLVGNGTITNSTALGGGAGATEDESSSASTRGAIHTSRFSSALEDLSTVESLRQAEKAKFITNKMQGQQQAQAMATSTTTTTTPSQTNTLLSNLFVKVQSDLVLQSSVGSTQSVVLSRVKTPQESDTTNRRHTSKKQRAEQ